MLNIFRQNVNKIFKQKIRFLKNMDFINIDGSYLEGGGQILRISTALSVLLKKPIRVEKIRACRKDGGLKSQHLTGIKLLTEISDAKTTNAEIKSTEISFNPMKLKSGEFMADTKTAGSICLIIQNALPCLIYSSDECKLHLRGGTNADFSPQIDYFEHVFKPISSRMNIDFDLEVLRRGFYPQGGGEIYLKTKPVKEIKPIELTEFGGIKRIYGQALVAGVLPIKIALRMAEAATLLIKSKYPNIPVDIKAVKEKEGSCSGNGACIIIVAETNTGCLLAGSEVGAKSVLAENVAKKAAESLIKDLECEACVDEYLQDQLIIFMALANGKSKIKTGPLSLHTKTAIHFTQLLSGAKFNVIENQSNSFIIECDGIGFRM